MHRERGPLVRTAIALTALAVLVAGCGGEDDDDFDRDAFCDAADDVRAEGEAANVVLEDPTSDDEAIRAALEGALDATAALLDAVPEDREDDAASVAADLAEIEDDLATAEAAELRAEFPARILALVAGADGTDVTPASRIIDTTEAECS